MRNLDIHFHADPAHGWAEIPLDLIQELGISGQISRYSYRRGENAYLEEDCDLALFMRGAESKGWIIKFIEHHSNHDSVVRSYQRFTNKGD
jgi:hypothetical protein